jgi:hypothetical protein
VSSQHLEMAGMCIGASDHITSQEAEKRGQARLAPFQ